eukprot:SAG31_NODE_3931_length_3742_cov_2.127917_4_plen_76_part_00
MQKKGAIILATGGDNSNSAMGKFYEVRSLPRDYSCFHCLTVPHVSLQGVMVTGVTTDATDELVQANIVAVGYKNI